MTEKIVIIDFGSQYTQLIARKIRELNVYSEIHAFNKLPDFDSSVKGIILSGSPFSVNDSGSPKINIVEFRKSFPVLGICYGAQLLASDVGGIVSSSKHREYGRAILNIAESKNLLFKGMNKNSQVWMSHADSIMSIPSNFRIIASTNDVNVGAFQIENELTYGIQFHPEVYHTSEGNSLLHNFVVNICACTQNWTPESFIEASINELRNLLGNEKVVLALSGGVDSTVAATLLWRAIGSHLTCIFVDNGLLRKNEFSEVLHSYHAMGFNIKGIDASSIFIHQLAGVHDPEKKRKIIGKLFIEIFEREAKKIEGVNWLAQGTIYPDVIESVSVKGPSATIKSHHNVGGLPEIMKLKIVEPLKLLFKDEVRKVGKALQLSNSFLERHPFPGPGLAIRIISDITHEKVAQLQEADDIFISMLKEKNLYNDVWQAATILLPVQSVGVMGDERTYENVIALRAVTSTDGMTADWCRLPYDFLAEVSTKIINKVKGINRVVYDISSKPPATIEWE